MGNYLKYVYKVFPTNNFIALNEIFTFYETLAEYRYATTV